MKKLTYILSGLAIVIVACLNYTGCSSTTVPSGGVPTGVTITPVTSTSFTVSWTRNSGDADADTIVVTSNGQPVGNNTPVIVASGSSSGTVTGVPTGTVDSVYVGSVYGRSAGVAYGTAVGIPTNVMLQSQNSTTIGAAWTRAPGDNGTDTMIVMDGNTVVNTGVSFGDSIGSVNGLSTGTVYTVIIASAGGRTAGTPWMTAVQTMGLQLYEFSSANASGLQLNGTDGQATVISASKANAGSMDFFLDDFQNNDSILSLSQISFEGAEFLNGDGVTWRNSFFDPNSLYVPGGLANYYTPTDFTAQIDSINNPSEQGNEYDIPSDAIYGTKGSRILLCETADGNFAKIEIVPDPNTGMLYSGSGLDKYITVNVSYQPIANKPYAARGRQVNHGYSGRPVRVPVH
jgi:hypothetical protein